MEDWVRLVPRIIQSRKATVLTLVVFVLLSGIGPGLTSVKAATHSDGSTCREPLQDIPLGHGYTVPKSKSDVNATVTRVNASTVQFTYYDLSTGERDFGPSFPTWLYELGVRVKSAKGFQVYRTGNGASLIWNTSVETPSVTVTTIEPRSNGRFDKAGASIQPEWGFLPIPDHSYPTNVTLASGQAGFVGDQVLLLGNYTVYERSVGCHNIELYLPDALKTAESPTEIAGSLEAAARNLNVGWRYDTVRVFGVGRPIRNGGQAFTHEVWVNANSRFAPSHPKGFAYPPRVVPTNVWVHEYVHTRQRWSTNSSVSQGASWLTEGLASYYMVAETEHQGRMQAYDELLYWHRLNTSLRAGGPNMNLTKPSTYRSSQGDYTRGAYVLAALNDELRTRTWGMRSLEDVFYRLNQQDTVNYSTFRKSVVAVGGDDMGPWVDRYVAGTAVPPAPGISLEVYIERLPHERHLQEVVAILVLLLAATLTIGYHNRLRND